MLEAAAELGYVPNQAGRSLRKGTTGVVGFMMQTGAQITGEGDVFFMSVFDGVQTVFARHQLDLVALLCSSEEDPDDYLQRIVARGFADALIISATKRVDPRIEFLANRKIPFVALGRSETDAGQPWLDLDFAESYRKALAAHGIPFDPALVFRAYPNERGGHQIAQSIASMSKDQRPTGFVLTNEVMSVGLYRGLYDSGLEPGRDFAIIGRDSPHAHYLTPKLTCFRISLRDLGIARVLRTEVDRVVRDLGIALAEALLATMPAYADQYRLGVVRRVVPMQLIEGDSDAPVR